MKIAKKAMGLVLSLTMVFAATISVGFADTGAFEDVSQEAWYADGIYACFDYGIVNGTSDTTFTPEREITRGEFVTMLYRAYNLTEYHGYNLNADLNTDPKLNAIRPPELEAFLASRDNSYIRGAEHEFTDVEADSFYAPAVSWAHMSGYVEGIDESTFAPNQTITREQMMTILYRYQITEGIDHMYKVGKLEYVSAQAKYYGFESFGKEVIVNVNVLNNYDDGNTVSEYAKEGVSWGIQSDYINGVGDNLLDPAGTATRAQVATILARMLNNIELASAVNTAPRATA